MILGVSTGPTKALEVFAPFSKIAQRLTMDLVHLVFMGKRLVQKVVKMC